MRLEKAPVWLKVKEVLEGFGSMKNFHEYVVSGSENEIQQFYSRGRLSPVLGGKRFIERIRTNLRRLSSEYPRDERRKVRPRVESVLAAVAKAYATATEALLWERRGKENEGRKVAMYLVKRCCDLTLQETASRFRVGSYGLIAWACHGVQSKMEADDRFRRRIEDIQRRISQQKI